MAERPWHRDRGIETVAETVATWRIERYRGTDTVSGRPWQRYLARETVAVSPWKRDRRRETVAERSR